MTGLRGCGVANTVTRTLDHYKLVEFWLINYMCKQIKNHIEARKLKLLWNKLDYRNKSTFSCFHTHEKKNFVVWKITQVSMKYLRKMV